MTRLYLTTLCLVVVCHYVHSFTIISQKSHLSQKLRYLPQFRQNHATRLAASAKLSDIDDTNYKQILFADSYEKAVLVDAYATYCGPCKLIEPILEECATKWQSSLDVVKFNIDASENANLKLELLMQKAMPRSLPCLLLFIDGKVVSKHSGVITEDELDSMLAAHVKEIAPPKNANAGAGFISMVGVDRPDDYMISGSV